MEAYDTSDYKLDACQEIAKELRASGRYASVTIRPTRSENGVRYGRVYVRNFTHAFVSMGAENAEWCATCRRHRMHEVHG